MKITMVVKVMPDGTLCQKCQQVHERLKKLGHLERIDHIVTASDEDPDSTGNLLAGLFQVDNAPFFIVEEEGQEPVIYTAHLKLMKEVLARPSHQELS